MKPDTKKYPLSGNRPVHSVPLPINQGKIVLAVVLIGVMAFMWFRVFLRHGKPAAAAAKTASSQTAQAAQAAKIVPAVRLSYSPLTVVPGRQDRLTRDLFSVPDSPIFPWQQKPVAKVEPTEPKPVEDPWVKEIRPAAERIVVDAIGTDPEGTAQVFILDRFLSVGDSLPFKLGQQQYELRVREIHSSSVVLEWQDHTILLKMSEPGMSGDK